MSNAHQALVEFLGSRDLSLKLANALRGNPANSAAATYVHEKFAEASEHVTLSMHPSHGGRMLADGWSATGWEGSL